MIKKQIQKPENWQDFETLCKKLWGEIYDIPTEIKKNGRNGQNQNGVDVYGIPKGQTKYIGIQCKGKDDYTNAQLTKQEIDIEINKSLNFEPKLGTLIFATTANKDSKIEEYIRLKNEIFDFKILLYSWEDIADLIESNKETYSWYVENKMHQSKFNFNVLFNDFQENIQLTPLMSKNITKYNFVEKTFQEWMEIHRVHVEELKNEVKKLLNKKTNSDSTSIFKIFEQKTINKSWIEFKIILQNNGSEALENWYFKLKFTSGVQILDDYRVGDIFMSFSSVNINKNDPRNIDVENKTVEYRPVENPILIQKDFKTFLVSFLVEINTSKVTFDWELNSRYFNKTGTEVIYISPIYETNVTEIEVYDIDEEKEEVEIDYLNVQIKK